MKHCYRVLIAALFCVVLPLSLLAQNPIPNFGFENWPDMNPDSWSSTNAEGQIINVTQTVDSHSGS